MLYKVVAGHRMSRKKWDTPWEALDEAMGILSPRNNAVEFCWCGTDAKFYEEVTDEKPERELTEDSYIIGESGNFALVRKSDDLDILNWALKELADNIYIQDFDNEEE